MLQLSVVIPAYNEERLLPRCLSSVRESSAAWPDPAGSVETIVCDNHSTDRTAEVARAHGARVVYEPINQIARARNCGARAASGQWLLFLDADSLVSPPLLADLAAALTSGRVLGGGATVFMEDCPRSVRFWVGVWNRLSRVASWAPGGFLFCERAAFAELGGFSEELFVSEEIEFSRRMKRLARRQGRQIRILDRHPLVTSPRKLRLYSRFEHLQFFWQYLRAPWRTARSRNACPIWYDGRR